MPQYAILRFEKHKGGSCRALEAHHERQKEKYASNPNIDIEKSKYNFHIIQPTKYYRLEVDERVKSAGCKTRKDSTMFVDTLITASTDLFKGKKQAEIKEFFKTAVDFITDKIGKENIFSAWVIAPNLVNGRTNFTPTGLRNILTWQEVNPPLIPGASIFLHGYLSRV